MLAEHEVVWDERRSARLLDAEMPPTAILEARLVDEHGQHEIQRLRALGQIDQRVELGHGFGRAL